MLRVILNMPRAQRRLRKGISDLTALVKKLSTTRAVVNGGLTILGSALGSGIVTALHSLGH